MTWTIQSSSGVPRAVDWQPELDSFGVAVLVKSNADFRAGNDHGSHLIAALNDPGA